MGEHPTRIGRYTVARSLGSGGMGEVFLAYSPAGDPVAAKLIRSDQLNPMMRQRFEKEAQIARTKINTNRVARFLDADPFADRPWLAMEYIPGHSLHAQVENEEPLSSLLVASLGALLAEGLDAVHRAGLLHRDLKPQNIILGDYGPVVIDFGLAAFIDRSIDSLSRAGMLIGTPRCMSPEQAGGNPQVTSAADVYSLGTILLYAATGHYPYPSGEWQVIVPQVANPGQGPDLSGLPDTLMPLITGMMAHQPEDRLTLDEVMAACAKLMEQLGVTPAGARRALIDWTLSADRPDLAAITPSVEDRLARRAEESDISPLDGPQGDVSVQDPESEPSSDPEPVSADTPKPRLRASERIAEELRHAYALRSSL